MLKGAIRCDPALSVGAVLVALSIDLFWFVHGYALDMPLGNESRWLPMRQGNFVST
jgi:hypothetical protein